MIARVKLWRLRSARRKLRQIEGERIRQGKLAARRKAWANDPMRGAA